MTKFKFEVNEIEPTPIRAYTPSEYKRVIEVAKIVSACPFTRQQVIELERIWNNNRNQYLSGIESGAINSVFYTGDNISEFIMENSLSLRFKGHDSIFYRFDQCFITGVLISKILKKWESTLSNMDSDILRVIFIHIELLRIINFSQSNMTDDLIVPKEVMTKILWEIDIDASEEQMLMYLNLLYEFEEYVKTVEFRGNGTFIMTFHKPVDYDLEKFDIFNS